MALTPAAAIMGRSQGTVEQARAYAQVRGALRPDDVEVYLAELFRLCGEVGVRFEVAFAQFCDETGTGTSRFWRDALNPAGIGALETLDRPGEITDVGRQYADGKEAARAHLVHLWLYAKGEPLPPALKDFRFLDPRADAVGQAGFLGKAHRLSNLAGTWAANPNYAVQIANHANRAFPELTNRSAQEESAVTTRTFGTTPCPQCNDRPLTKPEGHGQNNLGQRKPKGVVYHRMIGTLWGTDGHFANPTVGALTDYGVGTIDTDGAQNDGVIIQWNDPEGHQSGWASGPWENPPGDGRAYVAAFGLDSINRDLVSIEISGRQYEDPISDKAVDAVAALSAFWADRCGVPWETYPLNPATGLPFTFWHNEFQNHKPCPGRVVMDVTPAIVARTKEILRRHQTGEGGTDEGSTPDAAGQATGEASGQATSQATGQVKSGGKTALDYPPGMDKGIAARLFGKVEQDGTTYEFGEKGLVSRLWLVEGGKTGQFPPLTTVQRFEDAPDQARTYFTFANGLVIWRPNDEAPVRVMRSG